VLTVPFCRQHRLLFLLACFLLLASHARCTTSHRTQAYGLDPATTFADITPDPDLAGRLSDAYGGDIDSLDAFTGALAEETMAQTGGMFGDLLFEAWSDQFYRSIAGDR